MVAVYSVFALTAVGLVSTASASSYCTQHDCGLLHDRLHHAVATLTNRGICDVALANPISDPTIPFAADTEVIVPTEVCQPDDTSCFTVDTTNFCLLGGPHLYYTQRNGTYRTIALKRFNITLESVLTALSVEESQANVRASSS